MPDQVSDWLINSMETAITESTRIRIIVRISATPFSLFLAMVPRFLLKIVKTHSRIYGVVLAVSSVVQRFDGIGCARVYPVGALASSHASNTLRGEMFSKALVSVWNWPVFGSLI